MRILFLDTASSSPSLALATEERTVAEAPLPKRGESEIVPILEGALAEAGWNLADLTEIACVTGPGGFASIRVGVTAANTLAWALKIPIAGVHLSDLWAVRASSTGNVVCHPERSTESAEVRDEGRRATLPSTQHDNSFLWLHSTQRNALFVRGFGDPAKRYSEATLLSLDEAKTLEGPYVGELLEEHKKILTRCAPLSTELILPLAEVLPKFLRDLPYTQGTILPWYGREA